MEVTLTAFRKRFTYDPIKDLLGKGGFAKVYKAYDNEDQLFVALKIAESSNETKYNLTNEIKRFKRLNHLNIIQHIEAYEVNTGSTDIHGQPVVYEVGILEYADSGTLADLLKNRTADYRQIEDIAHDIINGLAYLHTNGIIHRDLKPSNILLFADGARLRAKITDFGIAKQADNTAVSTQIVGTVEYMSPEYFTTGNITTASDLWSLGVMLLEAATGVHPFGKTAQGVSNEQIINNILNKDISTATENLPEPLKKIITDCLRREPIIRPQSAEELKADFTREATDTFSEKTQVIGKKTTSFATSTQEIDSPKDYNKQPKWKPILASLFDFDVQNGKWEKVVAKELLLFFMMVGGLYLYWQYNGIELYDKRNSDVAPSVIDYITHFLDLKNIEFEKPHGKYFKTIIIRQNPIAYAFYFLAIRWIIAMLWQGLKTLGISFPVINATQKKTIGISVVVLLLSFVGWKGYEEYENYKIKKQAKIEQQQRNLIEAERIHAQNLANLYYPNLYRWTKEKRRRNTMSFRDFLQVVSNSTDTKKLTQYKLLTKYNYYVGTFEEYKRDLTEANKGREHDIETFAKQESEKEKVELFEKEQQEREAQKQKRAILRKQEEKNKELYWALRTYLTSSDCRVSELTILSINGNYVIFTVSYIKLYNNGFPLCFNTGGKYKIYANPEGGRSYGFYEMRKIY